MKPAQLAAHFEKLFGTTPRMFRAPGRVNLIGEHTDYNDGFVMPAAVEFSTYVAIAPRDDRKLTVQSEELLGKFEFDLDHLPAQRTGEWCDYVLGVARVLMSKGHAVRGCNLLVHGEVPVGSGLSSSAALEVSSALALLTVAGDHVPLPQIAQLCQEAENTFVGARVGIMDQFVSCMGKANHAILLDCRSLQPTPVPIPARLRLVVCNTMVKHDHSAGAYNQRRSECEEGVRLFARWDPSVRALRDVSVELFDRHASELPPVIAKRCAHVIREDSRTLDAAKALAAGDLKRVGELMAESHRSLRDLYEVSSRELDIMVDAAQGLPGFCGGRMTGGGFGGCTVNLVDEKNANDFAAQIAERFERVTGIHPPIYVCSAEAGAEELS